MRELRIIARYIAENYPSAKIVEIGIGHMPDIAIELKRLSPGCEVIVTDVKELAGLPESITFVCDDVTKPDLDVYRGAALIYAIRPPPELQPHLLKLARKVGAKLLVKPLAGESLALRGGKPVNYGGTSFYVYERSERGA